MVNEGSIPSVIPQTFNRSKLCNSLKTTKTKENVSYETLDERQASSTTASFGVNSVYYA